MILYGEDRITPAKTVALALTELITTPGMINTDFADVKMIMSDAGSALMGIGYGTGENRAVNSARQAISSHLLEAAIEGAASAAGCDENDLNLDQVQGHMRRVWGSADEAAVESILRRDRTEQLEEVAVSLDSAALGKVLVTAKSLLSTQMLAAS